MCFEFEYLYWAKLEEEARQRKEDAQRTAPTERSAETANQDRVEQPRERTPA